MTDDNENLTLKEIYPTHFKALEHAGLVKGKIPTLKEEKKKRATLQLNSEEKKSTKELKVKARKREIYFCIGYSDTWTNPIHIIIKKLKAKARKREIYFCIGYSETWTIPIHRTIKALKKDLK